MPPADDLTVTYHYRTDGYFVLGQGKLGFFESFLHKKIVGHNGRLITEGKISHQISFCPFGTGLSIADNTMSPFSSAKPVTRNSDINGPICFFGKFTTPIICLPTNSF